MFFGDFLAPRKSLARRGESRQTIRLKRCGNKREGRSGKAPLPVSPMAGGGETHQLAVSPIPASNLGNNRSNVNDHS